MLNSYERSSQQLQASTLSEVLRLDADDPSALVVDWRAVNTQPEKHQGYAVQWFAMSLALMLALVFANSNLASVVKSRFKTIIIKKQEL